MNYPPLPSEATEETCVLFWRYADAAVESNAPRVESYAHDKAIQWALELAYKQAESSRTYEIQHALQDLAEDIRAGKTKPDPELECNGCDWVGKREQTCFVGEVGPLCPECRDTTTRPAWELPGYLMDDGEMLRMAQDGGL